MAFTQPIECLLSGLVIPSTGARLASGKVRFYDPGTTTPALVYSNAAGTTPIDTTSTPLTLTAGGTSSVWTKTPVRMIAKDSTDTTTLYDIDGINATRAENMYVVSAAMNGGTETRIQTIFDAWDDSAGGSAGYWKLKQAAAATERNIQDVIFDIAISVDDYGAVGDDATDNATAIQNAINAAVSAGVRAVYVPPGTYRISTALTASSGITIFGRGETSVIKQTSTTANLITASAGTYTVALYSMTLRGSTTSSGVIASCASGVSLLARDIIGNRFDQFATLSLGTHIISDCQFTANTASTANFIVGASTAQLAITGSVILGVGAGTGISWGSTDQLFAMACEVSTGGTGVAITSTGDAMIAGCGITGSTASFTTAAGSTGVIKLQGTKLVGAVSDGRTGSPVTFTISTGTATPLPLSSDMTRIIGSTGSGTVTVGNPGAAPHGTLHGIICSNTSGGSVTWTFNAAFVLNTAVAPSTGNRTNLTVRYSAPDAKWYEFARAETAN